MPLRPQRVGMWGLAVYAAALAAVAFWPQPVDRPVAGLLHRALAWLHRHGVADWLDYGVVESAANVLLFVPLGALVAAMSRRGHWWLGAVTGLLTSSTIELAQLLFLPARYASPADVLANTLGALLGSLFALPARRRRGPAS